jgi:hypothetical protein
VKKQKHEQEPIIGAGLMLNFFLSYEEYKFMESISIAVASTTIYKVVTKSTISKDLEIKVLSDPGMEVPIISPYFMKKI